MMQDWAEQGISLRSHFKDRVGVSDDNRVSTLIDFVITTEKASGRRMDLNTLRLSTNLSSIHMG